MAAILISFFLHLYYLQQPTQTPSPQATYIPPQSPPEQQQYLHLQQQQTPTTALLHHQQQPSAGSQSPQSAAQCQPAPQALYVQHQANFGLPAGRCLKGIYILTYIDIRPRLRDYWEDNKCNDVLGSSSIVSHCVVFFV